MRVIAALLSTLMLSSVFADSGTKWLGQWTPYVYDGRCRLFESYNDRTESNFSYAVDILSLIYWPDDYEIDSIWAIADRWSIKPSEIFLIFSGPGNNDEVTGEIDNYPLAVSVAGVPASNIEMTPGPQGYFERTAFLLKEPDSIAVIEKILEGEPVSFDLELADQSSRSFKLTSKDGSFFNVRFAQLEACIEEMPSNKSLKRTP